MVEKALGEKIAVEVKPYNWRCTDFKFMSSSYKIRLSFTLRECQARFTYPTHGLLVGDCDASDLGNVLDELVHIFLPRCIRCSKAKTVRIIKLTCEIMDSSSLSNGFAGGGVFGKGTASGPSPNHEGQ